MPTAATYPSSRNGRVLVASSRETFRKQWIESPQHDSSNIGEAAGGADALAKLESENWEEVWLDSQLHDLDVGEVVRLIRLRHPHLLVRVIDPDRAPDVASGWPGTETELNANVQDLNTTSAIAVENPDCDEIVDSIEKQDLDPPFKSVEPLPGMLGAGPGLEQTFRLARLVGRRQTTVLITGETGTGKELVARGIHQISPRAKSPFVVVNCAAIPEQLLEAELFGHARGAFTGAVQSRLGRIHVAHGGTLFLDEVGELPLSMQAKLLRFLQDGEVQRLGSSDVFSVDVRVISATNVNLLRCVQEKQFRQDLYYRLAVFPLELPSLRQRKEDIIPLATHFLDLLSAQSGTSSKKLSPSAATVLREYPWPGNVRELQHAVERAFIMAEDEQHLRASYFNLPEVVTPLREI